MIDKIFKLKENKTSLKIEVVAGLSTFFAMAYILGLAPNILGDEATGLSPNAVFFSIALCSALSCIVMGFVANMPVGLAPGIGIMSMFTFTIVYSYGYTGAEALAAIFLSAISFVALSLSGLRQRFIDAIPHDLKIAICSGLGFFVAMVALVNSGIVVKSDATLVTLGDLSDPVVLLSIFGIVITMLLVVKNVRSAPFLGLLITAALGLALSMFGFTGMPTLPESPISLDFDTSGIGAFITGLQSLLQRPEWFVIVISVLFVDFFDTSGTLIGLTVAMEEDSENSEPRSISKALIVDSGSTLMASILGSSSMATCIESSAGILAGGKTGVTTIVVGLCFFSSLIFAPIVLSVATSAVTCSALFVAGFSMAMQLRYINWHDQTVAMSSFVAILFMVLSYSIVNGIAFGFVVYFLIMLCTGRLKELNIISIVITAIFVAYLLL